MDSEGAGRGRIRSEVAAKVVAEVEGVADLGRCTLRLGKTCGALEPGDGSRSHHNSAGGGAEGGEVTAWREGLGVGEE